MTPRRIVCTAVVTAALIGTGSILPGRTVAYMTRSRTITNSIEFDRSTGLEILLTEPGWDPDKAQELLPGATVPKDPQLTNTSLWNLDELAAMRIEFVYTSQCPMEEKRGKTLSGEDMDLVRRVVLPDYEADGEGERSWVRFDGEDDTMPVQHFYYSRILKRNASGDGDTTVPLFTGLRADPQCGNDEYERLRRIGGFSIRVEGAAIEKDGIHGNTVLSDAETASRAGLFLFPSEV